jgi:hypothetical protein
MWTIFKTIQIFACSSVNLIVMSKKNESTGIKKETEISPATVPPRDGLDNTGTQGYDSLTDDAFTGTSTKPSEHPGEHESGTGSSSDDFTDASE